MDTQDSDEILAWILAELRCEGKLTDAELESVLNLMRYAILM